MYASNFGDFSTVNKIFTKIGADFTQSGSTSVKVLDSDYFAPYFLMNVTSMSVTSGPCVFSIGTNSPNYDNWMPITSIYPFDVSSNRFKLFNSNMIKEKLLNGQELFLKIHTPFSGTFVADLYGIGFAP